MTQPAYTRELFDKCVDVVIQSLQADEVEYSEDVNPEWLRQELYLDGWQDEFDALTAENQMQLTDCAWQEAIDYLNEISGN